MSLKSLVNQIIAREQGNEHTVNTEQKSCSSAVNMAVPRSTRWPCPHCGQPAEIEAVELSRDGTRTLTYWCCSQCEVWAVTPHTVREPPSGWASSKRQ